MPYRVNDIIKLMEEIAPPQLAESWDNVGLLVGSGNQIVKKNYGNFRCNCRSDKGSS